MLINSQKIFIALVFLEKLWKYAKKFFESFEHTWLCTTNLWNTLSASQKYFLLFTSFLRCYILKNPAIWLTAFWPITREPEFCQIWHWWWNINYNSFHIRLFPRKTNNNIFQKIQKKLFWDHFGPYLFQMWAKMNFGGKKPLSVFKYYNYLISWKKAEKTNYLIRTLI